MVNVTFTPSSAAAETGTLTVSDNAPDSPQSLPLSGTGVDPSPQVTLTPPSLSFGNQAVGTSSDAQQVTITNTGTATLNISSIAASGDFAESGTCAQTIGPGQNCAIGVVFKPAAQGPRTGSLTFSDNAPNSPQTLALSGSGAAPFTLSAASSQSSVLRGGNQASFVISATSSPGFSGAISLSCGGSGGLTCQFIPATIEPGGNSTLTVSNLSSVSADSLNLSVDGTSGAASSSVIVSIDFEDFALAVSPPSASITAGSTASYQLDVTAVNGFSLPVSLTCSGVPAQATCSLSPSTVTPNGASASSISLSVTTTAAGSDPLSRNRFLFPDKLSWPVLTILALFFLAPSVVVRMQSGPRRAIVLARGIVLVSILAFLLTGCGGGGASSAPGPQGTPPGSYTLTIQASSGSLSHSTSVSLLVN